MVFFEQLKVILKYFLDSNGKSPFYLTQNKVQKSYNKELIWRQFDEM